MRVGVLGLDNYQAIAYTQLFNDPKATGDLAGLRVVAAFAAPASSDIAESVESLPKWKADIVKFDVKLVASIDELLRNCDAVMIMSLDGRTHLEQATPVLKATAATSLSTASGTIAPARRPLLFDASRALGNNTTLRCMMLAR